MGRSLARLALVPGLGAEPLMCVPLCCAVQSALLWGKCKSLQLSLCSVLTLMGHGMLGLGQSLPGLPLSQCVPDLGLRQVGVSEHRQAAGDGTGQS